MRKIYHFALSIAATLFVVQSAWAQSARVVDLGPQSFTNTIWYDSQNDLAWVGGTTINIGNPDQATLWSIDEVDTITPVPLAHLQPGGDGVVGAISRDGAYVGGATSSGQSNPYEGTVWQFGQWNNPTATGYIGGGLNWSEIRGIAGNGTAAGYSSGSLPFDKTIGGPIHQLPGLPGGTGAGTANAITTSGDICLGQSNNGYTEVAVKWTNGGTIVTPLEDPVALFSSAGATSSDTSLIGGIATDNEGTWASVWINGSLQFITNDQGQKFFGYVNALTEDGLFAGTGAFGIEQKAFVWHQSWQHAMTLEEWLQQNGVATPPMLEEVTDVYHDGSTYHFAVEGVTSSYYIQTDDVDTGGGQTFDISATPNPVQGGQWVTFTLTGGEPAYPALLLMTKINGYQLPFPIISGIGYFNASGELSFNRRTWWWFNGTQTFQGVTVDLGYTQLLFTPELDLVIQ